MEKSLNEKISMAKVATDELTTIAENTIVDGDNIESVLDRLGFNWYARTEYETIIIYDQTYNIRFFLSSDWSTITYELTDEDAWEEVLQNSDFDYLSENSKETSIFQTSNCCGFVDDDGCERSMRAQCIVSN